MSFSEELCEFVGQKLQQIDDAAIAQTKLHIADAIAIALAAQAGASVASSVLGAMRHPAPNHEPNCTIFGGGYAPAPSMAAFANASLIHILDFDDIHDEARLHPTCVTLPAALAAIQSGHVDARRLVESVLIGNEVMCRMGKALRPTGNGGVSNWFLTQVLGYFGATLTAGHMMGLSEERMIAAFGLAYMQAAGGKEPAFGVGANSRGIYPAFAAAGGVQSAIMAANGLSGPASAFDGAAGLFQIYFGEALSTEQQAEILAPSGWVFSETEVKPWPSCRLSHPYVSECLALRAGLDISSIDRVVVSVNESANKLCQPLDQRVRPRTLADAKYSIPFMVAYTLVTGAVDLANLTEGALNDRRVLALAEKIRIDHSLPDCQGHPPAKIEVISGSVSVRSPQVLPASLGRLGIQTKFSECLQFSQCGCAEIKRLWEICMTLEQGPVERLLAAVPLIGAGSNNTTE